MSSFFKQRRKFPFWLPIAGVRAIFTKNLDLTCAQGKW